MTIIHWDHTFSVNNDELDIQHKKWIAIFNNLFMLITEENPQRVEKLKALKALEEYSRYHFSFEEEYMRKIKYPFIFEHRRIHVDFDDLMYTYYRKALEGDWVLDAENIHMLKEWILYHIVEEDKKYVLS